jgi:phospholipid/cholesterol/gamma-HCH transport system substrate-binding protein
VSRRRLWRRHDEIPVVELQKSNPVRFGLVVIIILVIAVYFGFNKHVPFKHGFRLKAVFPTAVNVRPKSPVRIAGVNVGKVTSIQRQGNTGLVTMDIENQGLPIHSDATLKIRPRIFLEGNLFVELQPGSPSAKILSEGATIPITQTSDPVQLDQVLGALNSDTRTNLQEFLLGYGQALNQKPTAAQNAIQDPEVRGLTGAQAFNKATQRSPAALEGIAIVNQALGGTHQHDISDLVAGITKVSSALNVHEQQLGELIGNWNTFMHSLAAQSSSLSATVAELPGALQNTSHFFTAANAAFPSMRSFALAIIPGVKQTPSAISAALPWIVQLRGALGPAELGGIATGLRVGAPGVARLTGGQTALQTQTDQFSKCLTNVIFPAGNTKIQDGSNTSGVEDYKEFWYSMTGLASLGQSFDGNGVFSHFLVGGGGSTLRSAPVSELGSKAKGLQLVARAPLTPEGTRPAYPSSEPPYKPLVPCSTQALPNFNGPLASGAADGGG